MANEISVSAALAVSKGGVTLTATGSKQLDMGADDMRHFTQIVGTSAEVLEMTDITGVPGYLLVKNLDATNYVELALDSGMTDKICKLLAGQVALFPPSTATIYALANTASCRVEVLVCEA